VCVSIYIFFLLFKERGAGAQSMTAAKFESTPCLLIKRDFLIFCFTHRGADKSLARPPSRCILFDGENMSFDASLVIYINSTNIHPIVIINRIYEYQNLLSL
jgi:hypothetical protein